jgi:hypothetical protein
MSRRWKIFIFVAALLLLAVALTFVFAHVQPDNELAAYQAVLRARGEKLDLAAALSPPAAPAENGALDFSDAIGLLGKTSGYSGAFQMAAPGRAVIAWHLPAVYEGRITNSWEQLRNSFAGSQPALALLGQALNHPKLDFELRYDPDPSLPLPHISMMQQAAQELATITVLNLHDGDTGQATTNLLTILAIAQRDWRDDFIISHLVRAGIAAIGAEATWELLQATNVTDVQLAAVQGGWQQMNFLKDAENTFAVQRLWTAGIIEKARASHANFTKFFDGAGSGSGGSGVLSGSPASTWEMMTEAPSHATVEALWRSSWSFTEELQVFQQNQIILETLRAMQTNHSQFYKADFDQMATRLLSIRGTNRPPLILRALAIPDFPQASGQDQSRVLLRTLKSDTEGRIVVTAIALKRFQLQRGQFPVTLAELTPAYLPAVIIDPFDGKPLKYRPNDDGTFLLYSVGEDGIDDGGDAGSPSDRPERWLWTRNRDWVWPQPATPAEVQFYLEHPPVR